MSTGLRATQKRELRQATLRDGRPVTAIVVGKSGVGKSTLINAILGAQVAAVGIGAPLTKAATEYTAPGRPITLVDTPGIELGQDEGNVLDDLRRLRVRMDYVDLVLFCVRANDSRFEAYESRLISALAKDTPVFLVLTQSPVPNDPETNAFADYLTLLRLPVVDGHPFLTLAKPINVGQLRIPAFGVPDLVIQMYDVVTKAARRALIAYLPVSLRLKIVDTKLLLDMVSELKQP